MSYEQFNTKLLTILLVINFVGIALASTIAAIARPLYGLISLPIIVIILSITIYLNRKRIFDKKRQQ